MIKSPAAKETRAGTAPGGDSAKHRTTHPALLLFHSPRSGRCRRVDGFVAQVLQHRRNHDSFAITRIDCDQRPDLAERFHVDRLPTLIVVEERVVRSRLTQPRGCAEIEQFLRPWLR
jgi:thioredoxin-like negative regulator of GroEL